MLLNRIDSKVNLMAKLSGLKQTHMQISSSQARGRDLQVKSTKQKVFLIITRTLPPVLEMNELKIKNYRQTGFISTSTEKTGFSTANI